MVNLITIDGSGHKVARPVTNREEYFEKRNTPENTECFRQTRGGNQKMKGRQVQFNYNDLLPDGVLRGCCHPASTFAHDIDCGDAEACREIARRLIDMKDETGLLELSESANYGLHGVFRRELGKTILENQVRIATLTQTEMDTSTHDLQRVMFTGPATDDVLLYLDDAIFDEPMTVEESAEEMKRLKEREAQGLEDVPPGAKKANKHYKPEPQQAQTEVKPPQAPPKEGVFDSVEASARTRFIVEGVMKEKGLERSDFLDEGGRHTSVKVLLSGATQLLTKDEVNGALRELMPDHWQDDNIRQLVSDFYKNYTKPSQRLTRYQEQLFVESRR